MDITAAHGTGHSLSLNEHVQPSSKSHAIHAPTSIDYLYEWWMEQLHYTDILIRCTPKLVGSNGEKMQTDW